MRRNGGLATTDKNGKRASKSHAFKGVVKTQTRNVIEATLVSKQKPIKFIVILLSVPLRAPGIKTEFADSYYRSQATINLALEMGVRPKNILVVSATTLQRYNLELDRIANLGTRLSEQESEQYVRGVCKKWNGRLGQLPKGLRVKDWQLFLDDPKYADQCELIKDLFAGRRSCGDVTLDENLRQAVHQTAIARIEKEYPNIAKSSDGAEYQEQLSIIKEKYLVEDSAVISLFFDELIDGAPLEQLWYPGSDAGHIPHLIAALRKLRGTPEEILKFELVETHIREEKRLDENPEETRLVPGGIKNSPSLEKLRINGLTPMGLESAIQTVTGQLLSGLINDIKATSRLMREHDRRKGKDAKALAAYRVDLYTCTLMILNAYAAENDEIVLSENDIIKKFQQRFLTWLVSGPANLKMEHQSAGAESELRPEYSRLLHASLLSAIRSVKGTQEEILETSSSESGSPHDSHADEAELEAERKEEEEAIAITRRREETAAAAAQWGERQPKRLPNGVARAHSSTQNPAPVAALGQTK